VSPGEYVLVPLYHEDMPPPKVEFRAISFEGINLKIGRKGGNLKIGRGENLKKENRI
jgi:hypothetical protein